MDNLDKFMRPVADLYLHTQVRKREVLPQKQTIHFQSPFDTLLAEIIVILEGERAKDS